MNEFVRRVVDAERSMSEERGPFTFFALFQRRAFPGDWDVVAAAPWIGPSATEAIPYLVERLQASLPKEAMSQIGRVAPLVPHDQDLADLQETFHVEHGAVEVWNREFFGVEVRHAYIITAQRVGAGAEAVAA